MLLTLLLPGLLYEPIVQEGQKMEPLVSIKNLSKNFGSFVAVNNISFSVGKGEVLGFLGPNGAGKTTTMRMITGYFQPTSGDVKVCGLNARQNSIELRKKIGYLPEGGPLYSDMTPQSFLSFIGEVRGLHGELLKSRIDFVVDKLHLASVFKQNIETLSKGYKRRVALAQAIIHDPEVLIMDEPTDGLDPNQKYEVRELIKSMAKDKAIIISTHILEEVGAICGRAVIISRGKVVAEGAPGEIMSKTSSNNSVVVRLRTESADKVLGDILTIKNVDKVKVEGKDTVLVFPKSGKDIIGEMSDVLYKRKHQVEEIFIKKATLDEAFRELTI
jgi:ABC-2 type transport system ATP-binding protein